MQASSEESVAQSDWHDLFVKDKLPILALMVLALWLHATNTMLAATTLPVAALEIGGLHLISWAFSLYLLGSVLVGTTMSLYVSRLGIRNTMLASAAIYLIGCLVCGTAQHMPQFLIGRTIQGIGGGGMVALVYIIQSRFFHESLIPRVVACMSVVWMVSSFFGPMIGGVFATLGIWRYAFLVFAVQAVVLICIVRYLVPTDNHKSFEPKHSVPVTLLLLLTICIFMVCAAANTGNYIESVLLVTGGIALLVLFVRIDAKNTTHRLLPAGSSQLTRPVGAGLALTLCMTACLMSFVVYGPIILIRLYGLTPLSAGFVLIIEALSWGTFAILFSGRPASQERFIILTGSTVVVLGIAAQSFTVPDTSVALIALALIVSCGGFGVMWGYIIKRVVSNAPDDDKTRASSIMPVTQQVGFALGAALAGVIANGLGFSDTSTNEELRTLSPWLFAGFFPVAFVGCLFAWWFTKNKDMHLH